MLLSPLGSFASVLSLFIAAFWLVHFVTKKTTQIQSSHDVIKGSMSKMESNIDEIRRDVSYLKGTVDIIKTGVSPLAKSNSPMSLTQDGIEIAKKLKAPEMIARNWSKIQSDIEINVGGNNAYDIQQYCWEGTIVDLSKFLNSFDFDRVKMYAFSEGKPMAYYAPIFAILIRDKYFETKNINAYDVDYYDPQLKTHVQETL